MRCTINRAVKVHGTRFEAGAVIELAEAEYAQLLSLGVVSTYTPPPVPSVRIPRSAQEKQAALDEAKKRLAKTTGHAVDANVSGSDAPPEP